MRTGRRLLQGCKDLLECVLTDPLDALGRQRRNVINVLDNPHLPQLIDEIIHGHVFVEQAIFLGKLLQPLQCLLHITAGLHDEVAEQRHHLLQPLLVSR